MTTKTQLRAICPCCFGEWAFDGGMSAHGYTVTHGYFQGACPGRGEPHFGTEAGRVVAVQTVANIEQWARAKRESAVEVRAGRRVITDRNHNPINFNTAPWAYRQAADQLESQAQMADRAVKTTTERINNWAPAEPREIVVESGAKARPVHLRAKRWGMTAGLCAASAMGAQRMWRAVLTDDHNKVTCTRCLKEMERGMQKLQAARATAVR